MPFIIPIENLRNTTEISNIDRKEQKPEFVRQPLFKYKIPHTAERP